MRLFTITCLLSLSDLKTKAIIEDKRKPDGWLISWQTTDTRYIIYAWAANETHVTELVCRCGALVFDSLLLVDAVPGYQSRL